VAAIFASPNTLGHAAKVRLVVIITLVSVESLDGRRKSQAPPAWLKGQRRSQSSQAMV
jgi:hypothetical protein